VLSILMTARATLTVTAHNPNNARLKSIDESVVYKALTVIEGDILIDKFCECERERQCRSQKRNIIVLTQ
jgi:hypothetical protein